MEQPLYKRSLISMGRSGATLPILKSWSRPAPQDRHIHVTSSPVPDPRLRRGGGKVPYRDLHDPRHLKYHHHAVPMPPAIIMLKVRAVVTARLAC